MRVKVEDITAEAGPTVEAALLRSVFSVTGRAFRWADVVLAARVWSDWSDWETATREGVACLTRAAHTGVAIGGGEFDQEEERFRRARRLLAAEELHAWLSNRGLDVTRWRETLRGTVLRRRWPAESDLTPRMDSPPTDPDAVWAYGNVSGGLDDVARRLSARAAVAAARGALDLDADHLSDSELLQLDQGYEQFVQDATPLEAMEREIERHRLEWLRVDWRSQAAADPEILREVALCIREDGMSFDEAAATAGTRLEERQAELERINEDLRSLFMSASPGSLVGPLEADGEHWLIEVVARTPPSLDDPRTREMARSEALNRALETEAINWVRWDERV
jgi:hypothetical protein